MTQHQTEQTTARQRASLSPFRDEILSLARLADIARDLGESQQWTIHPPIRTTPVVRDIDVRAASLEADYLVLASDAQEGRAVSPASEWLLDNYYLIEEQVRAVKRDLPADYGVELPRLTSGPFVDFPRLYEAGLLLASHTDARFDEESVLAFVDGYQDSAPLAIGEVWAIPTMLRFALIENLYRLSARVVITHLAERDADAWAERLLIAAQDDPAALRTLLDDLGTSAGTGGGHLLTPAFFLRLSQRLQGDESGSDAAGSWLDRQLAANEILLEEAGLDHQRELAADQVSIANSITSIRFLDAHDWDGFFERCSLAEAILREDPAGVYHRMDFRSRDRYRHALEGMARRCPLTEIELAEACVSMALTAQAHEASDVVHSHVGHYLIRAGRYDLERAVGYRPRLREVVYRGPLRNREAFYTGSAAAFLLVLCGAVALFAAKSGAGGLGTLALTSLAVMPLWEIALSMTNRLASLVFPPRAHPRLDWHEPLVPSHRTIVVVPALLSSVPATQSVIDNLEIAYLANRDDNVGFMLLGDLRGSDERERPGDQEILEAARLGVEKLNARYLAEHDREPFHLLIRERVFDRSEQLWMGWERKRGSLVELARLLRGDAETTFSVKVGDTAFLRGVAFVLTIDADTILPRDAARKMACTVSHPLNRARLSPKDERVKAGYGLVQPRVSLTLPGAHQSAYAWIYSGTTGVDPYVGAVSDTYQDVFGEGSFTGKGIFEARVFSAVLEDRFPDDTLLSHDLLEGCFLRTALASDVEVFDDYPASYLTHMSRLHRWVRGDWQTLPWLAIANRDASGALRANPLTWLHRWKIIDNLRRSLVPAFTMAFFSAGWFALPKPASSFGFLLAAVVLYPAVSSAADALLFRPKKLPFETVTQPIREDLVRDLMRTGFELAVLPHLAWSNVDAILRALWRMGVSRRGLLEWETAGDAAKRLGSAVAGFVHRMGPAAVVAIILLLPAAILRPYALFTLVPLAVAWGFGPLLAWRISQQSVRPTVEPLSSESVLEIRRLARKTWRFFETFVVAEGHHLAPDNFQEDPRGVVAWRTSPTNVGLQLLSTVSAADLGYLTMPALEERVSATLAAMAGLERFGGHFYNWYDINTLQPLRPAYVSTVDSGNLAGHLLVLRIALLEMTESPLLSPNLIAGTIDTVHLALEDLAAEKEDLEPRDKVAALQEALDEFARSLQFEEEPRHLGEWSVLVSRIGSFAQQTARARNELCAGDGACALEGSPFIPCTPLDRVAVSVSALLEAVASVQSALDTLAPWALHLADTPHSIQVGPHREALRPLLEYVPSLVGLAEGLDAALDALDMIALEDTAECAEWAAAVARGIRDARPACVELLARMRLNAAISREMWEHTDFKLLFDERRLLFSIGYNIAEGRLDRSFYDMLASECRLASFLAIAKGDVPQEHWFRLGRNITPTSAGRALVSWSASMFEYLMPLLVMRSWEGTLLDETYHSVVKRQVEYGKTRDVPWGVSESAFNAKDPELTYQYQAFGVPGLGLKRGLSEDIVIAPYASVLALPLDPNAVVENLRALRAEGAEGRWGMFESVDYTPGRVPAGDERAVVKAYFAHHQGMSMVALANEATDMHMRERFHADPLVASAELLLQERVPRHVQYAHPHVEEVRRVRSLKALPPPVARTYPTAQTPVPATHFLSNGRYSVMITNGGGGYSRYGDIAVSRYREDVTRDCWGTFFYVRDLESDEVFSAPHNPWPVTPEDYRVDFAPDKAEFRRLDGELETSVEVAVSPEEDVEVRRLTITNHGRSPRTVEVTSYFEISFSPQASDQAHKSFSNLFVETEALDETQAILFSRRPRSSHEERIWGFHVVACNADEECPWQYETDRARFLGRLRGPDAPAVMTSGSDLSNTVGAVLDPAASIRRRVEIGPGESARVAYSTGVAETRDAAVRLTEKYHDLRSAQRAIDLSWTAAQIELRDLGITPQEAVTLQRLASRLLLTDPVSRLKIKTTTENAQQMSGLWSLGISGDLPILLVRVEELEHAPLVRQALLAHQYWRHKGLVADLVILNTRPTGYSDALDDRLRMLLRTGHALQMVDKPGGVFLRRSDQMHPDVLTLLLTVARATLDGDGGSIELQLNRRGQRHELPAAFAPTREPAVWAQPVFERPTLLHDNGLGGFDASTGDYVIVLEGDDATPAPWINVIATETFGCTVSEAGVGCTWALNSHENRVTTWNNDPVSDGSGEAFYFRDEHTGEYWSPTPLPVRGDSPYVIRHGKGFSRFDHTSHGIASSLDWFVSVDDPVRICRLRLENLTQVPRSISITHFVEWVLGDSRSRAQHVVVTHYDGEAQILTAHNHFNLDFPGRVGFLGCDHPVHSYTGSRSEFVGRNRRPSQPAALDREGLGGITGRFHDNCGAVMTVIDIEPGAQVEVAFFLGQTAGPEEYRDIVTRLREPGAVQAAYASACAFWRDTVGTITARTPDTKLDLLVNGNLLYQALSCRLWGRTATYQSSGAFGFRDQLQDSLALLLVRPDLVRRQIVEASRHQFERGDVQHWWQPLSGRGVRTRITDDRHWLPLVVADYLRTTGDWSVLDEQTAWLEAPELEEGREDAYIQPAVSERVATVYEHCVRALESGRGLGPHGLPLMGGGDWNDGMNRVGIGGDGESVWLAWFLAHVLQRFAPVCEHRGESDRAEEYRAWAARLGDAVERTAWDGSWYRRAYFDDGTPLGTRAADECRIDAIAQAWAVISGVGDPDRARIALDSVEEKLVRREDRLIALLTPPFDSMSHDPGYIKGYVPGVRENGGQYTHAATWVVLAHLLLGDADEAISLLDLINPVSHALDREAAERYVVEPYVVAADVYAAEPHVGRGGWTWYTGSASWFFRVTVHHLLGLHVSADESGPRLHIDPCIPKQWGSYEMSYRRGTTTWAITVNNPRGVNRGVARVTVDGADVPGFAIPLIEDDRTHAVVVTMLGG